MINQQSILEVAIKNEKDRKIKERLKAVRFVLVSGYSIDDATKALLCHRSVHQKLGTVVQR